MERTEAFHTLASADRQLVLHELVEKNGEINVEELSRQVAARRHRIPPGRIDEQLLRRAQVRLVHSHFPYLAENDLIDVDWNDREVSLTDEESVDQLFEAAEELDSWPPTDLLDHPPP